VQASAGKNARLSSQSIKQFMSKGPLVRDGEF